MKYKHTRKISLEEYQGIPMKSRQDEILEHVNREEAVRYNRQFIGSVMPVKERVAYYKEIGERFMRPKKLQYKCW